MKLIIRVLASIASGVIIGLIIPVPWIAMTMSFFAGMLIMLYK
jgi:hypothetical protein